MTNPIRLLYLSQVYVNRSSHEVGFVPKDLTRRHNSKARQGKQWHCNHGTKSQGERGKLKDVMSNVYGRYSQLHNVNYLIWEVGRSEGRWVKCRHIYHVNCRGPQWCQTYMKIGSANFQERSHSYAAPIDITVSLFGTMTNKWTIISQIITLLHVSTLSFHPQGAGNQYPAN